MMLKDKVAVICGAFALLTAGSSGIRMTAVEHLQRGGDMKTEDLQMGTWKLNEPKSKLSPEANKITTSTYAPMGDRVKITVDGVNKDGQPVHDEWTGTFDGKDYPVTGDPRSDMRSYRTIDEHTLELTAKKAGTVVTGGFIVISADGTSRTAIVMMNDPSGKKVPFLAVYDKE